MRPLPLLPGCRSALLPDMRATLLTYALGFPRRAAGRERVARPGDARPARRRLPAHRLPAARARRWSDRMAASLLGAVRPARSTACDWLDRPAHRPLAGALQS